MEVICKITECPSLHDCPHAVPHKPIECGSRLCNNGMGCDCRDYPKECANDPLNRGCKEIKE
jgi:hypothetical protein